MSGPDDPPVTVLNVNDTAPSRYLLTRTLQRAGFTVVEAGTGAEALERAAERPDAVVLDVILPDIDGFEVCRRIKSDPATSTVPVLLTSATLVRTQDRVFGLDGGADGYLVQPAEPIELVATVRSLVRARRAEAALAASEATARFLADSGEALASSLDPRETAQRATALAVPTLGDWCFLDLVAGPGADPQRSGVATVEPTRPSFLEIARSTAPESPLARLEPLLVTEFGDEHLALLARAPEHRDRLRQVGIRSLLVVPLLARGECLGTITLAMAASNRRHGRRDVAVAQEFARRAAVALDNARLYEFAQEAGRLKDEFLSTVSHELRTPLHGLLGWTRLLREGRVAPEKLAGVFSTLERNARTQAQIVDDILDVSRIVSGKLHLEFRRVDLGAVVGAAVEVVRPTADARGVALAAPASRGPLPVLGDADRLQQVVWNLLANAVKFTPRGGRVAVDLALDGDVAELSVRDTGAGIAPEHLAIVFERFRQVDSSFARRHGGLGLGLAIVRHLVELHGGAVEAHSDGVGRGSTFRVRLPIAEVVPSTTPSAPGPARSDDPPLSVDGSALVGLTVLAVDDEPDALELLAAVLSQRGARVLAAASAADALRAMGERPDVIVSDLGMPDEDGYSLIARVRRRALGDGGATPAIALSAYARREDADRALEAGFQHHVAKPLDPEALVALVARAARAAAP